MRTIPFQGLDCVAVENRLVQVLVTRSVGPRIISLSLNGGENLLAVLPDFTAQSPAFGTYHFYGGHRLWAAPEHPDLTYISDDGPVEVTQEGDSLRVTKPVEAHTGVEKSMRITLASDSPEITVEHRLTNRGALPITCAPWAITQLKPGGVAILPQSTQETGLLANRVLTLWPYTDVTSPHIDWGNQAIFIRDELASGALKVGFPNPRGWLAYWRAGTLFVKQAAFDPSADYFDFGSSSECYCNDRFAELETLGPVASLAQGDAVSHLETWKVFEHVDLPSDETALAALVSRLGLDP